MHGMEGSQGDETASLTWLKHVDGINFTRFWCFRSMCDTFSSHFPILHEAENVLQLQYTFETLHSRNIHSSSTQTPISMPPLKTQPSYQPPKTHSINLQTNYYSRTLAHIANEMQHRADSHSDCGINPLTINNSHFLKRFNSP